MHNEPRLAAGHTSADNLEDLIRAGGGQERVAVNRRDVFALHARRREEPERAAEYREMWDRMRTDPDEEVRAAAAELTPDEEMLKQFARDVSPRVRRVVFQCMNDRSFLEEALPGERHDTVAATIAAQVAYLERQDIRRRYETVPNNSIDPEAVRWQAPLVGREVAVALAAETDRTACHRLLNAFVLQDAKRIAERRLTTAGRQAWQHDHGLTALRDPFSLR